MKNIQGILFDLDGTLVNTEIRQLQAWKEIIEKHGHELPPNWQLRYIGHPDSEMAKYCCTLFADLVDEGELLRKRHEHYRYILGNLGEGILFPGVREGLAKLNDLSVSLAVGSNSPAENVTFVLDQAGLASFFKAVVTFGMTKRGKPGPDIFLLAAKKLGLSPSECMVIEDTASGIQAGLAAGCWVIAVANTCAGLELYRAERVFPTTAGALQWIINGKEQGIAATNRALCPL